MTSYIHTFVVFIKRSNDNTTKLLFDNIVIFLQLFMCINVSMRRKHMRGPIQNGLNDINISNKFCSIMKVFCVKKRQNKRCMTKFFTRNLCYLQKQHFIHNYHKILKHFFNSKKSCHMYKMIHTIFIIANSCDIRTHHFLKLRYRNKWGVEILTHSFVAIAEKMYYIRFKLQNYNNLYIL